MLAAQLTDFRCILDLPSGYGRVLRTLKAYFPNAKLAACDLDKDAVEFCRRTFNAIPLYSATVPKDVKINDRFDLIWVGSLLTHLDNRKWDGFLELFDSLLNPNGLLVVTTHGRRPAEWIRTGISFYGMTVSQLYGLDNDQSEKLLRAYDTLGFGYVKYHSQNDYGISLSSPAWVLSHIQKFANLRLVTYLEYGWDNHQDVVALIKMTPSMNAA
jgi:cyclopropane fatty-acyl-phospholipid synthase-like methyltransferase